MSRLIVNCTIIIVAILSIYFQHVGSIKIYNILKPITTILILSIPIIYGNRTCKKYFYSVIVALIFCLIGDIFLLENDYFLYGLVSFLIGHLFFLRGFISLGGFKKYLLPLALLLLIGVIFYSIIYDNLGTIAIPVAFYIIAILIMGWQGINLYLWKKKQVFLYIAIAVVLFLISDSLIAVNRFYLVL